jgi:hypothetical protein
MPNQKFHFAYTPSASWVLTIHVSLADKSKALPRSDCETPHRPSVLPNGDALHISLGGRDES